MAERIDLLTEFVLRIGLFAALKSKPSADKLQGYLELRRYQAGEVLCRQGEAGWTAFYILTREDVEALVRAPDDAWDEAEAQRAKLLADFKKAGADAEKETDEKKRAALEKRRGELSQKLADLEHKVERLPETVELSPVTADGHDAATAHLAIARPDPGRRRGVVGRLLGRAAAKSRPRYIPIDAPTEIDYDSLQATIRDGELFGEMSCLYRTPRSATVTVNRDCYVLVLWRNVLDQLKRDANYRKKMDELYRSRVLDQQLRNLPLFADLSEAQVEKVRGRVELVSYRDGQVVMDEHDRSEDMFIIRGGLVKVVKGVSSLFTPDEVPDWPGLWAKLANGSPAVERIRAALPERLRTVADASALSAADRAEVVHALNGLVKGEPLWAAKEFAAPAADEWFTDQLRRMPANVKEWPESDVRHFNRLLLETALPGAFVRKRPPDGPETILAYRSRGELLGEMGLLLGAPRSATVLAFTHPREGRAKEEAKRKDEETVELVRIPASLFRELMDDPENESLRRQVEAVVAERRSSDRGLLEQPVTAAPSAVTSSERFESLGLVQGQRLMLIDLDRCTRCDECVKACVDTHPDRRSRLFLDGPRFGKYLVPTTCRSCRDPVCLIGCPVGSIHRGNNREIVVEDWCIGCDLCARQCPYGSIQMHDLGLIPEGARGWRLAPVDPADTSWTRRRFPDSGWALGRAPFRNDRELRAAVGDLPPRAMVGFRVEFRVGRDLLGRDGEFQLVLTTADETAAVWVNGRPLAGGERKMAKRTMTYSLAASSGLLRKGRNVLAVRVGVPDDGSLPVLDVRLDALLLSSAALPLPKDQGEKDVTTHRAVVCDLCSSLPGKVPSCVNACPHDAAMRVDAVVNFPAG